MMNVSINEKPLEVSGRITILEAAKKLEIRIPTLCHNDKLTSFAGCRICLVEVATKRSPDRSWLAPACNTNVEDGFIVKTDSEEVRRARIFIIELLLSRCPESEELRAMAKEFGVPLDDASALGLVGDYLLNRAPRIDPTSCILCGLCVRVCAEIPTRYAINFEGRGMKRRVTTPFNTLSDTCIGCGSCAYVCPTKTITVEEAS